MEHSPIKTIKTESIWYGRVENLSYPCPNGFHVIEEWEEMYPLANNKEAKCYVKEVNSDNIKRN